MARSNTDKSSTDAAGPMPWFRFYSAALNSRKVQRLSGDAFKAWVNILCMANAAEHRGSIPCIEDIAFQLRMDDDEAERLVAELVKSRLIDVDAKGQMTMHDWEQWQRKSDNRAAYMADYRAAQKASEQTETDCESHVNHNEHFVTPREEESREEREQIQKPEEEHSDADASGASADDFDDFDDFADFDEPQNVVPLPVRSTATTRKKRSPAVTAKPADNEVVTEERPAREPNPVWQVIESVCAVTGVNPQTWPQAHRTKMTGAAKSLLRDYDAADIAACAAWLWSDEWRHGNGVDMLTIRTAIQRWIDIGRPATKAKAPSRYSDNRPTPNYHRFVEFDENGRVKHA